MYRQIITPDEHNHSIDLPKKFFGKKVEVIMMELGDTPADTSKPKPPAGKKVTTAELLETFGAGSGFPSIEEIRSTAWPEKW